MAAAYLRRWRRWRWERSASPQGPAPYCTSTGPATNFNFQTPAGNFDEPGPAVGDTIVASMFQSGTSTWAELHDLTSGAYWVANDPINVGDTVIDVGSITQVFDGRPVPTFTKVKLSSATVNGDDLGFSSLGAIQDNALNGADVLIKAGGLSTTGAGSSFTLKFKHAS